MPNEQNLKSPRSTSEARERGRKGGIASGKARRERAMLREAADAILCQRLPPGEHERVLEEMGIPKTERTQAMLAALGMVVAAQNGNPTAFKRLMELRGEGIERHEVNTPDTGQLESILENLREHRRQQAEEEASAD